MYINMYQYVNINIQIQGEKVKKDSRVASKFGAHFDSQRDKTGKQLMTGETSRRRHRGAKQAGRQVNRKWKMW